MKKEKKMAYTLKVLVMSSQTLLLQMCLTQSQQLDLFKEYKAKLTAAIGKERTDDIVARAAYLVSSGTNDFTFNYNGPITIRKKEYPTIEEYQKFQWQLVEQFLKVCNLPCYINIFLCILRDMREFIIDGEQLQVDDCH